MRCAIGTKPARAMVHVAAGVALMIGTTRGASGQGCMPLHFTTPSLGGQAIDLLNPGQWQVGLSVRRVATNRWFAGDAENEATAPFGQPVNLRLNSGDLSVTYALSGRTAVSVAVPFSYGTLEFTNPDLNRHQLSSGGLGDISATANMWLAAPTRHPNGNVSLGLGVKAPTGSYHLTGASYGPTGVVTQPMLNPTMQLGDGGWAILAQGQAFQQVFARTSVYASGVYSASLREHSDEMWKGLLVDVPDVYSARAGLGFALAPDQGVSVSLGGRIDGTTMRNLFGKRDDNFRDAGYYAYVEPGIAWVSGINQFTLNVPVRVHANYYTRFLSNGTFRVGMGGVNDYIIYAGWSRRL
jgi:hypothetical protein